MSLVSTSNPIVSTFSTIPKDIYYEIFKFLRPIDFLIVRAVAKSWQELADNFDSYWQRECSRRLGEREKINVFIKGMREFNNLVTTPSPNPYEFISTVHSHYINLLNPRPFFPQLKFKGIEKSLVAVQDPVKGTRDLFFIGNNNSIRRIPQIAYLNPHVIEHTEELISFPNDSMPLSLCPYSNGFYIGTEQGSLHYLDLSTNQKKLSSVLKKPLEGKIISIQVDTKESGYTLLAVLVEYPQDKLEMILLTIEQGDLEKTCWRKDTYNMTLSAKPKFTDNHILLCPMNEGGIYCLDSESRSKSRILLLCNKKSRKMPKIIAICPLDDRIVLGTNHGRIGWITKNQLLDDVAQITWYDQFNRGSYILANEYIEDITPIGASGFCVHSSDGAKYPNLLTWEGDYKVGEAAHPDMRDPVWLENGTLLYHDLTGNLLSSKYTKKSFLQNVFD